MTTILQTKSAPHEAGANRVLSRICEKRIHCFQPFHHLDFDHVTYFAPADLAIGVAAFFAAGVAKGAAGFAFPMVAVSGLALTLPVDLAVGVSILPTFASNIAQAFRDGLREASATLRRFWPMNLAACAAVCCGAGLAPAANAQGLTMLLGATTAGLGLLLLAGPPSPFRTLSGRPFEGAAGALGGLFGAVVGFATPPILLWYAAQPLGRDEFLRALGATFLLVSAAMAIAHAGWGTLTAEAARLGLAALAPSALGLWLGARLGRRLDQARFQRLCAGMVALCGIALLRRGLV
jgi:uncharacterized membrane protein YfcA